MGQSQNQRSVVIEVSGSLPSELQGACLRTCPRTRVEPKREALDDPVLDVCGIRRVKVMPPLPQQDLADREAVLSIELAG